MRTPISILLILIAHSLYSQGDVTSSQDFWDALSQHCGKSYEGTITEGGKAGDGFTGERLVMHVMSCSEDEILIPFNAGANRSRTWILRKGADGRIQLKHDHRHEDGSKDKVTMYGGTSANLGSGQIQTFPADEETRTLLPHAASNIWWITLDDKEYTYNLKRLGTSRIFRVSFDLTREVETPEKSWGW